jgi:hypothetical protein
MAINLNKQELDIEGNMLENVISNMNSFNALKKSVENFKNKMLVENSIIVNYEIKHIDFQSEHCWRNIENKNMLFNKIKEDVDDIIHSLEYLDVNNENVSLDIPYKNLTVDIIYNSINIKFAI